MIPVNSGDIILLAEVLRDLARDIEDGERSYSERIIYETAIYRLAMEYSFVYMVDFEVAKQKVVATAKDKIGSFDQKEEKEFDVFKKEYANSPALSEAGVAFTVLLFTWIKFGI